MQKKPSANPVTLSSIQKNSGQVAKHSAQSGGFIKGAPPPKPMVTAAQRQVVKDQRRTTPPVSFPTSTGMPTTPSRPAPPARPAVVATSAASTEALEEETSRFSNLQNDLLLSSINSDVEDIDSAIAELPANLENIRARGYIFKSYLEKKIETLGTQWQTTRPRIVEAIQTQTRTLQTDATNVQNILNRRQAAAAALSALESKVQAATSNLQGMYDTLDNNVNQTQQQIDDVSWTLQQVEQASYGLLPTEAPVEAVPANWKKPGDNDGVEGVLLLTDQRLVFEQKEEVATKKVLFITTEKQKVQALNWQIPAMHIEKAVGSTKGFMGKDDFLTVHCTREGAFLDAEGNIGYLPGTGGKMPSVEIHLKGETGEAWQGFVGRVKSREIDKERTTPVDTAAAEAVSNAPTNCPTCGALMGQTILRGQTEIKCEYCGAVVRL